MKASTKSICSGISALEKSDDPKDKAISAYLEGLLEKASAASTGITLASKQNRAHDRCHPAVLGDFSFRLEDPTIVRVFMPRV
jgi:hypothetical protein